MTVTDVQKDVANGTLVVTSEFDATPERIWRLWADPTQLSRWWGPPTWPATFTNHELTPGGTVSYFMTGPDGDKAGGYWRVLAVDPPKRLEFEDGFAGDDGKPNDSLPIARVVVTIEDIGGGRSRMSSETTYATAADLEKVLAMGMEEGMREALSQIEGLLAEDAA